MAAGIYGTQRKYHSPRELESLKKDQFMAAGTVLSRQRTRCPSGNTEGPERPEETMSNSADRMVTSAKEGLVYNRGSGPRRIARVFIDVDTQRDFMYPHGAGYFPQAGRISPMVARLFRCARSRGYPVISTTMCLRSNDSGSFPAINGCIEGTNGQKKPAFALLAGRTSFGPNGNTDLSVGLLRRCQQVIFEKRGTDPFEHPKFDRLLTRTQVEEYVVFGVAVEDAVKHTVMGLLARGKQVKLVIDASASRDTHQAEMALRLMIAKGVRVITARELAPTMQPRLVGAQLRSGGNGNGNGKKSKAHGSNGSNGKKTLANVSGNGNGNGNGKKSKAHGSNGHNGKKLTKKPTTVHGSVAS